MVVNGFWRESREEMCIVNVYAPRNLGDKILLWDMIALVVGQKEEVCTCIIRDFNYIMEIRERVGVGGDDSEMDRREFGEFVVRSKLWDVALKGRKYTCYHSGGACKSRLDRALINDVWTSKW